MAALDGMVRTLERCRSCRRQSWYVARVYERLARVERRICRQIVGGRRCARWVQGPIPCRVGESSSSDLPLQFAGTVRVLTVRSGATSSLIMVKVTDGVPTMM